MQNLLPFPIMPSQGLNLDIPCLSPFFSVPSGHLTQSWLYPEGHSPWMLMWELWLLLPVPVTAPKTQAEHPSPQSSFQEELDAQLGE